MVKQTRTKKLVTLSPLDFTSPITSDMDEVEFLRSFGPSTAITPRSKSAPIERPLIDLVCPQPKTSSLFFARLNTRSTTKRKSPTIRVQRVTRTNVKKEV